MGDVGYLLDYSYSRVHIGLCNNYLAASEQKSKNKCFFGMHGRCFINFCARVGLCITNVILAEPSLKFGVSLITSLIVNLRYGYISIHYRSFYEYPQGAKAAIHR